MFRVTKKILSMWEKNEELMSAPVPSGKYLVVVQVVGQASYKQFVGGIGNDCGDNAYKQAKKTSLLLLLFYH